MISIVIPAHNEAAVIARCLEPMLQDARPGELEILVMANGCKDDTVAIASRFGPPVRVIDLKQGSKPLAINTGLAEASGDVIFVVDADVLVDVHSLRAAAEPLRSGRAMVSAPCIQVDCSQSTSAVRRYYDVWTSLPYARQSMVGSGVYGMTRQALAIVGEIPKIIGDDAYVRTKFPPEQRLTVSEYYGKPACFTVFPPRRLADLVHIEVRRRAADEEMRQLFGHTGTAPGRQMSTAIKMAARRQLSWIAVLTYVYVKLACRLKYKLSKLRGTNKVWRRDDSSRPSSQPAKS